MANSPEIGTNVSNQKVEGLTVTMKYTNGQNGRGYDEPWAVFHGNVQSIKAQMVEYFGMTPEEHEGLPLHAVVLNANKYAHGTRSLTEVLGGTVTAVQTDGGKGWGDAPAEDDPWRGPAAPQTDEQGDPGTNPHANLIAALEAAADVQTLKRLWAENRPAFDDPQWKDSVIEAYKTRGQSLSGN